MSRADVRDSSGDFRLPCFFDALFFGLKAG